MNRDEQLAALQRVVLDNWPESMQRCAAVEVGLSGGLDSMVLLHVLSGLQSKLAFQLSAVYVHHGLQASADEWLQVCARYCGMLGVPFRCEHVQVRQTGQGLEAAAREARYAAFAHTRAEVVALAHHRDDQVETFMLAALRGGGLRGLSGMPVVKRWQKDKWLWRPLLGTPRAVLHAYALAFELPFVEDFSNRQTEWLRNWLRLEGLPTWRERVPQLDNQVTASVHLLQQELAALDELVSEDVLRVRGEGYFDVGQWRQLSAVRQRLQLHHFVSGLRLGTPSAASLVDFQRVMLNMAAGKQAQWRLPNGWVYAYYNRLFAVRQDWLDACLWLDEHVQASHQNACLKEWAQTCNINLCCHKVGFCEEMLEQKLVIRPVTTDDVIELTAGHKNVRKMLQERKIPPFVRNYWPVVADASNKCVAVANIWVSPSHARPGGVLPVFDEFNCFVLEPK